jgi:regulatory protein
LDDVKFAQWWVHQRTEFRPRGARALQMELQQKGIDRDIIKNVLADAEIDEVAIAKHLYKKNSYKWKKYEDFEAKQKATQFLARKGFSWNVIKEVVQ